MAQYEVLIDKIMYRPTHEEIAFKQFLDQNNWTLPMKRHAEILKMTIAQGGFHVDPFFVKLGANSGEVLKDHFSQSKIRQFMLFDCVIPIRKLAKDELPTKEMVYFNSGCGFPKYVYNRDALILKIDQLLYDYNFGQYK